MPAEIPIHAPGYTFVCGGSEPPEPPQQVFTGSFKFTIPTAPPVVVEVFCFGGSREESAADLPHVVTDPK